MSHPRFPLPGEDACYLPLAKVSDPTGMRTLWLSVAQRAIRIRWGYTDVQPTGHYDAATAAAICRIQTQIGHKPNGELDEPTWAAVFSETKKDPLQ